ncbi:hypothetical protein DAPPUDRAFT_120246 [Daphnia pulex]|uniref:Protein kinase domain-containing protein n=1 Tax=Daphnia pulex TaxID=6669 RepID=E9I0Q3_DAPPU|nr:hypothetical protein DAPPUDRAFT_120246 [Daphnia pulex]|eukprot:EFX62426.1 hypothetical protein DAPPUDRAFT_120246 [Daphnia pulex]
MTPGRPQLPRTPRLCFKENDNSRFGTHDFPSTPKFGRSESTPELHRIRKLDQSLHMLERNTTQEKAHYNNVLQESNASNLLTLTSDSLPDIFQSLKESSIKLVTEGLGIVTQVKEEVPCADILKPAVPQIPLPGAKNEFVAWNQPEKSSFSTNKLPSVHLEMEEIYAFTNSKNKSGLNSTSDTASALGLPTQPTVKMHPLDQAQTPLAKNLTWTGHSSFSTTKIRESSLVSFASTWKTEMHNDEQKPSLGILLPKVQAETSPIFNLASSKPPQPIPIQPVVSVVAEVQPIDPIQHHVEQQSKLIPPVSSSNILPPPNARPTPKTKQIAVNGKVYSVMKPLGRGGSSVVYQNDIFALKVVRLDSVDEVTAEGYINEIRLLKQLQGLPRVVRLLEYEYNEEEEKLLLVMEKGDTDFATVIRTRTSLNAINPTLIRFYWQEMLEAVKEIHDKNVIHTDLKPANFLLVNGGLKFIDFGIATSIQADMTSIMKDSQCGTYNYMTPEAIKSATPSGTYQEYKVC